ncbi:putative quinol monooxygenase [Solimonas variicoloris]|uniref:putative quinol monooxygenase n=1 Tax=Solimonas variicoloris TaxID=254408 RepID=UPI000370EA0E|nr:antibiotic biosynthesis monooxygenase [Solimonas variicoloris]
MTVTHLAFVVAKPARGALLGRLLTELAAVAGTEPGCVDFAVHQSTDDPALWFLYSNWQSSEALRRHLDLGEGARFAAAVAPLVEQGMDVHSFVRRGGFVPTLAAA